MKSLRPLIISCLTDVGQQCCVNTSKDRKTILTRTEAEGQSFLTIVLPTFAQHLERALDQGYVSDDLFPGFRRTRGLPAFLQGFLQRIFSPSDGLLLSSPSHDCISAVRQVCNFVKKVEMDPTPARVKASFSAYWATELQVKQWSVSTVEAIRQGVCDLPIEDFSLAAEALFGSAFASLEKEVYECSVDPKHGPGAVQDKLAGNQKFTNRTWTERLEEYFPYGEYSTASHSHYLEELESGRLTWIPQETEPPVRVISVPKTQKTPRIIAIEPSWNQFIQQGLMRRLVPLLEQSALGVIGFRDQHVNQHAARLGSLSQQTATLDLSEASDRVNLCHLAWLFKNHTLLHRSVLSCRSTRADVPGQGITPLVKYASMGSALTFPIEAMVFTTIAFLGICKARSARPTRKEFRKLASTGWFRVYGDDIIVPNYAAHHVMSLLEDFGLRVNGNKSFWTGKFRESCGKDYYDGTDVTPVYLRSLPPTSRRDAQAIASWVATINGLLNRGFTEDGPLVSELIKTVKRFIPLPYVGEHSPGLGIHVPDSIAQVDAVHKRYQIGLVRAAYLSAPTPRNGIGGYDALLKCLLPGRHLPFMEVNHLERSGRPRFVRMKIGLVPAT